MAYTKIHAIKATVHKAINYICNPDKTDESTLISSYCCSPATAAHDFKFILSKTTQSDPNLAYHLIQAFTPGEVSYEEAHRIGVELADKVLEGKYPYIVSTHIDKGHVHNHIIFCAANTDHQKYNDCKKTYWRIRNLSDELCHEHGLSIITPGETRGKKYAEWLADKNNSSWKTQLKTDIDELIKSVKTYEEFCSKLRAKGYEIKGEEFVENQKYISFRPLDRKYFVRGSARSLGSAYTKECIRDRIEQPDLYQKNLRDPRRMQMRVTGSSRKTLIDTSDEKFAQNPGLKRWADLQNLKTAAAAYAQSGSIAELKTQIAERTAALKSSRENLVKTEHLLKDLGEILKYAEQYKSTQIYHYRYQKSKNQDVYFRRHETELLLHDGAEHMLKRCGMNPKKIDLEKLRSDFDELKAKKETLQKMRKATEKEIADFNRILENLNQYLDQVPDQKEPDQNLPHHQKKQSL